MENLCENIWKTYVIIYGKYMWDMEYMEKCMDE
jgi:hypothetical protein